MSLTRNAVRYLLWLFNTLPPFYLLLLLYIICTSPKKKKLMYGVHTHHGIICTRHSTYVFSAPLLHYYLTLCNVATHARAHTLRSIGHIHDVIEYMRVSSICFQLASKQPWQLLPISVCMYVCVYGLLYVCVIDKKNYCMTWLLLLNL